jgi:hypothetical protein
MSDDNATGKTTPKHTTESIIEDAVIVDDATGTPVVVEEATASETEPVVATTDPAGAPTADANRRVVYVQVPTPPKKLGNRAVGSVLVLVSAIVFTALLALVTAIVGAASTGGFSFSFLALAAFYIPTLFFVIAFVLLVLVVNRANWWAFIVGSLVVAVIVYFGSIGLGLLTQNIILATPDRAAELFRASLGNPFVIAAALLAREVSLWTGGIISRRGRRLRARNLENRAAYDRELAQTRAEHERAAAAASASA